MTPASTVHAPPAAASPRATATVPLALLLAYAVIWAALAVAPRHRQDWLLENLVVAIALPALVLGYRRLRFSNASYAAMGRRSASCFRTGRCAP